MDYFAIWRDSTCIFRYDNGYWERKVTTMKVLVVCNNAFTKGNGLQTVMQSLIPRLKEAGIDARLMSVRNDDPAGPQPDYPLEHFKFPIFDSLIASHSYGFARIDKEIIREAVEWADIVHLQEGFPLEARTARIADKAGKTIVGTFHLYSQNILANALINRKDNFLNDVLMYFWRTGAYDYCSDIHCPTETVRQHLADNGFKARMRVISNGIEIPSEPVRASFPQTDPIILLCIGRFAHEKSQMTLLEAMRYSRHADMIQIHFAGKGPLKQRYEHEAERLVEDGIMKHKATFGFYTAQELKALAGKAYLNIHCAVVEVEGLSCLEAIREGAVPVIAEGYLAATSQFALDERSIFPEQDAKALAGKIDWWIEHPVERLRMGQAYADSARQYAIENSIAGIIDMYRSALVS